MLKLTWSISLNLWSTLFRETSLLYQHLKLSIQINMTLISVIFILQKIRLQHEQLFQLSIISKQYSVSAPWHVGCRPFKILKSSCSGYKICNIFVVLCRVFFIYARLSNCKIRQMTLNNASKRVYMNLLQWLSSDVILTVLCVSIYCLLSNALSYLRFSVHMSSQFDDGEISFSNCSINFVTSYSNDSPVGLRLSLHRRHFVYNIDPRMR